MAVFRMINKMEQFVKAYVEQTFENDSALCPCERCRMDVLALSLNSLPPKYVVTEFGDIVTNVDLDSSQWKADIMMAVLKAVNVVKGKPRHGK